MGDVEKTEQKQPPKKRMKKEKKREKEEEVAHKEPRPREASPVVEEEVKAAKSKKKIARKRNRLDHPRTADMIVEAIENLRDSRGSSVQSIKAYILENYKVREDMIRTMMKKALTLLLKDNTIIRPKGQAESMQTLSGRYLMRPKRADEIEERKPRPPSLRQFKPPKGKTTKKKKKKRGFY